MKKTFEKYLEAMPAYISDNEKVFYIQKGYKYIIPKVRLDLSIHPLRYTSHTQLGGFEHPGIITGSLSEYAFKEIKKYSMCSINTTIPNELAVVSDPSIGIITATDYGYTTFEDVNDEHNTIPDITIMGTHIYSRNLSDTMIIIEGYIYPYLIQTADGPEIDYHCYDIATMLTQYEADELYVNPAIGVLSIMAARMFLAQDELNVNVENTVKKLLHIIINLFNSKNNAMDISIYSDIRILDGSEALDVGV